MASGRIGFALVGVDLVMPAYRVGLGIRVEELGILVGVLTVRVLEHRIREGVLVAHVVFGSGVPVMASHCRSC